MNCAPLLIFKSIIYLTFDANERSFKIVVKIYSEKYHNQGMNLVSSVIDYKIQVSPILLIIIQIKI